MSDHIEEWATRDDQSSGMWAGVPFVADEETCRARAHAFGYTLLRRYTTATEWEAVND